MKKKEERNEIPRMLFEGVTADGEFVFTIFIYDMDLQKDNSHWLYEKLKVLRFSNGTMEIAIDSNTGSPKIARMISVLFGDRKSNDLDFVILNYRNAKLKISKTTGLKDIISMLRKAKALEKKSDNGVLRTVDFQTCRQESKISGCINCTTDDDFLKLITKHKITFNDQDKSREYLWFSGETVIENYLITKIENGIVTLESTLGITINEFVKSLQEFFNPYSNFYGVKAVEVEVNNFSLRVDKCNSKKVYDLYKKSCDINDALWKKEYEEYFTSAKYIRERAKYLKVVCRKKEVLKKIRELQKDSDFTLADENLKSNWEHQKEINSRDSYSKTILEYAILWAQYIEYVTKKHGKDFLDIWHASSKFANIFDVTIFEENRAVSMLANYWKYGNLLKKAYIEKMNAICEFARMN